MSRAEGPAPQEGPHHVAAEPAVLLPFHWLIPLLGGAAAALATRLVFSGSPGQRYSAMLGAFIYFAPVLGGAVTVYLAERIRRRSFWYYLWAPWCAVALFVGGTLMIYIEGLICAAVIVPLFALMGSVGGLVMGVICRVTRWPRQTLYGFAALPLVLGAIEPSLPDPQQFSGTSRTIFIAAPPERVWRELNDARAIQPAELGDAWAWRIGVPMPMDGWTQEEAGGRVRHVQWQKNVRFDELITEWEPPRRVKWHYRFAPDSFPAGALDDHVVIGGHYFDLRDTAYTLAPHEGGTTLRIDVSWRVSTRFNWYADRVAQFLLGDFSAHILRFYKARSEAPAG